ncbi:MAG: hypothetical protein H6739_05695 [Alphaproteobacteria bacterium]|nr:hypothetical protein [Alphaproteobacteria bacterium]
MSARAPRVLLMAAAALIGLGSCQPATHTETVRVLASPDRVVLDVDLGEVRIVGADVEDVVAERSVRGLRGALALDSRREGDALYLEARCVGLIGCRSAHTVTVPRGVDVSVKLAEGVVELEGLEGVVDISVGGGQVRGHGLAPRELALAVGEGPVDLSLTTPPEQLTVAVGAGDVSLSLPEGHYDYVLEAGDGVVYADPGAAPRPVLEPSPRVDVTVARGDIHLLDT